MLTSKRYLEVGARCIAHLQNFCLYVEFRNSEAHQELVDKAQLIQEALTEKREE